MISDYCAALAAAIREWVMMNKTEKKRQREQYVVEEMIRLYCRRNHPKEHRQRDGLCPECRELADYAKARSQKCPFMETKTFCANCKVHCYQPQMREGIRKVMRFSGPRMLLHHPVLAVWHLICSKREKNTLSQNSPQAGSRQHMERKRKTHD